jgi:hypothetical protein
MRWNGEPNLCFVSDLVNSNASLGHHDGWTAFVSSEEHNINLHADVHFVHPNSTWKRANNETM